MKDSIFEKQIGLRQLAIDTFAARWHKDWFVVSTLLGSCIAAIIELTAETYFRNDPALLKVNQPDVLGLHMEFLRICTYHDGIIKVVPVNIGAIVSTIQLQLLQNGKLKVLALATSTNFDNALGPTVAASASWQFSPPPKPKPDFGAVLAHRPDPHWVPAVYAGEILPMTNRLLVLNPRGGFAEGGVCDGWNGFFGDERINSTYLAFMSEIMPSMSDTLLRNGGPYDGRFFQERAERWAQSNPDVPHLLDANSIAEASPSPPPVFTSSLRASSSNSSQMKGGDYINTTLTLDIEYKRRLPKNGLRFTFTRATAKTLIDGRMDVDLTICNEDMEVVCLARQFILVLGSEQKFSGEKTEQASKL